MEPFLTHTGRAMVLRRSNVDTDQIIPAEFGKRISRHGLSDALFARWRKDPDFVFNAKEREGATVLIADTNFGTGSSREQAVWALLDWGLKVVVATRFGDIFHRNALRNGLLAVVLPDDAVASLMARAEADPTFEISVDLTACEVTAGQDRWPFTIDERARWLLLNGLDTIEVTLRHAADIADYERNRPSWMPAIPRGSAPARAEAGTR
ncbi:3-isopropylmalate dehydratase small subunit [Streptomyces sp. enrichment culture]|uniref:3-isopropylmalate dehydratase small subunit n=1 Tax=Streptomyces sp. enrichment culture TaxID=1795815 RepID=UPI003F576F41